MIEALDSFMSLHLLGYCGGRLSVWQHDKLTHFEVPLFHEEIRKRRMPFFFLSFFFWGGGGGGGEGGRG